MSSVEPTMSRYFHEKGCELGLPISGTFELTPRCNFDCRMCYVHLSEKDAEARGKEIPADRWLSLAEEAKKRGMLFLLLTGGEPLVRRDFGYLYKSLCEMGLMVSVNTNGSLLHEYEGLFAKYPPTRFNISLYGASNDTYSDLCRNAAFDRVIANIRRMRDCSTVVKLNVSFGPYNVSDMEGIQRLSEELEAPIKPNTYLYPPIRVDENKLGKNPGRFAPEDAARYELICDRNRFDPETFFKRCENIVNGIKPEISDDCEGEAPSEHMKCRAGRSSFWVTWDGRMLPCGMMTEPCAYPFRDGFDTAWKETREATERILLPAECARCSARHVCHVCGASCLAESGRFDGRPDYLCKMVKCLVGLYEEEYKTLKAERSGGKNEDQS